MLNSMQMTCGLPLRCRRIFFFLYYKLCKIRLQLYSIKRMLQQTQHAIVWIYKFMYIYGYCSVDVVFICNLKKEINPTPR